MSNLLANGLAFIFRRKGKEAKSASREVPILAADSDAVPLPEGSCSAGSDAPTAPLFLSPRKLETKPDGLDELAAKAEARAADVEAAVSQAAHDRVDAKRSAPWASMVRDALQTMRKAMVKGDWGAAQTNSGYVQSRADDFDVRLKDDRQPIETRKVQIAEHAAALIGLIPGRDEAGPTIAALRTVWGDPNIAPIVGNDLAADRRISQAIELLIQASNELYLRDLECADRDLARIRVWIIQIRLYLRAVREMKIRLEASRSQKTIEAALENRVETIIDADHWFVKIHLGDVVWGEQVSEAVRLHEAAKAAPAGSRVDLLDRALKLASAELVTDLAIVERNTLVRLAVISAPTDEQTIDARFVPAPQPFYPPQCECCCCCD